MHPHNYQQGLRRVPLLAKFCSPPKAIQYSTVSDQITTNVDHQQLCATLASPQNVFMLSKNIGKPSLNSNNPWQPRTFFISCLCRIASITNHMSKGYNSLQIFYWSHLLWDNLSWIQQWRTRITLLHACNSGTVHPVYLSPWLELECTHHDKHHFQDQKSFTNAADDCQKTHIYSTFCIISAPIQILKGQHSSSGLIYYKPWPMQNHVMTLPM